MQDPYCLRCQPQVAGAALDLLTQAARTLTIEANAVTDNPLVLVETGEIVSGGNFHAEPVAFAADQIALVLSEIGAISERRIATLVDPALNFGLPPFLTPDPGLNSGFMIAEVTAAALYAENKQRAAACSIDSTPTSANQEDHVSMAAHAARRLSDMADNLAAILGIELLVAAQGIGLRAPHTTSPALAAVIARVARAGAGARWRSLHGRRSRKGNGAGRSRHIAGRRDFGAEEKPVSKPCRERSSVMNRRLDNDRTIRAPRGSEISAKSWLTEAPLRMLMNNLDPDVAERPSELVVYGGIGRAARDWDSFDRIVASLRKLEADQTLVVQSGKPVGIFRTHPDAPRVLIANSNLVPHWATLDHFNELDRQGLMMFGQMTAGSWIYIGSQGIVQGTYETFVEVGRRHYGGSLAGKWILTAGLGGMGGAQPLAATMAGASMLAIECQPSRIEMRLRTGYLDRQAGTLDEALAIMAQAAQSRKPVSVGLLGNAADIFPELVRRGVRPDIVTDQTSAHDPINGYLPKGWTLAEWESQTQRRSESGRSGGQDLDGRPRPGHAGFSRPGHSHARLWQQHPPDGEGHGIEERVRLPGLRSGLHPSAVLPRHRPVPVGGAIRAIPKTSSAPTPRSRS